MVRRLNSRPFDACFEIRVIFILTEGTIVTQSTGDAA